MTEREELLTRLEISQKACFDAGQHIAAMDIQSARAAILSVAQCAPDADLVQRCKELLQWNKTGILANDCGATGSAVTSTNQGGGK